MPLPKRLLWLPSCAAGHGALTYTALATAFSYIFCDPVFVFSLFSGLYLMAWGLGMLRVEKSRRGTEETVALILFHSLAGILLANPGIWAVLAANETARVLLRTRHQDLLFLILPLGIILTVCCGWVFGVRQAAISKLIKTQKHAETQTGKTFWEQDYCGAFAGIMIFAFIFNPLWGLIRGILLSQVIALGVTDLVFFRASPQSQPRLLKILIFLTHIYILISLGAHPFVSNALDAISGF
ncbi:MAG TPA: hypothetical protein PLT76_04880 [Candidatus Omnitrophota bacterium]|nr:hypothetical protein [Candidatus Omnitrophota bacterium]HQO58035.1 hypothetical protein [Candidatus Omnitrophota bacterium]HQP11203.1 hypothetical protein [Candidatus Omnitrophota bacterium]